MMSWRKRRLRVTLLTGSWLFALAAAVGTAVLASPAGAEETTVRATAATSTSSLKPARPYWLELTVAQREALAPLADDWERLDSQTKKKWVVIGNRYPRMQPDEQTRTRDRMREWAMLTPEQRRVARDSFSRIQSMPPEQRAEMLRKYQELPAEKRKALTSEGLATKPLVVSKSMSRTTSRRTELREGAKVRNPAVAAQKSASPIAARPKVPPAAAPLAAPAATAP
jgi:hypothetical protein